MCIRDGLVAVNPDGKMLLQPTVATTTKSGRQIFYPGGKKPTQKPLQKKKPPISIGGFENMSTTKSKGVHHNSPNKANDWFQT